jgi:hypothetical protein
MKNNKINHEWSVLCLNAVLDKDTNNLSLINLIEQISLDVELKEGNEWDDKKGDSFPLNMVIVSRLRKVVDDQDLVNGNIKVDFISPNKETISSFEQGFELGKGIDNIRMRFGIGGLVLKTSGVYYFVVNLREGEEDKYKKVYSLPLKVTLNIKKHGSN